MRSGLQVQNGRRRLNASASATAREDEAGAERDGRRLASEQSHDRGRPLGAPPTSASRFSLAYCRLAKK